MSKDSGPWRQGEWKYAYVYDEDDAVVARHLVQEVVVDPVCPPGSIYFTNERLSAKSASDEMQKTAPWSDYVKAIREVQRLRAVLEKIAVKAEPQGAFDTGVMWRATGWNNAARIARAALETPDE